MSTHDEGWSDFTHTTRTSKVSAHELFERYREFQGFIAGLREGDQHPLRAREVHRLQKFQRAIGLQNRFDSGEHRGSPR